MARKKNGPTDEIVAVLHVLVELCDHILDIKDDDVRRLPIRISRNILVVKTNVSGLKEAVQEELVSRTGAAAGK